jgi:hypothetical protein
MDGDGGKQRRAIKESLARLRSATFESPMRHPTRGIWIVQWGMIDRSEIPPAGSGPKEGAVWIGSRIAELVEHGSIVYLHRPTWDAIRQADELAGRLWTFLEGERLPAPPSRAWRHRLFNAATSEDSERQLPPIAELLQIAHWSVRRKVAQRVRQACAAICRADTRYELELVKSPQPGMWRLEARRRQEVRD